MELNIGIIVWLNEQAQPDIPNPVPIKFEGNNTAILGISMVYKPAKPILKINNAIMRME